MRFIIEEHASKYIATVSQITGIACCSILGSKIYNSAINGNLSLLIKPNITSLALSIVIFTVGFGLIGYGWYIMIKLDRHRIKQRIRKKL